jgi:sulfate adenylyltransferase subunit 2
VQSRPSCAISAPQRGSTTARTSARQGRLIDSDETGSMEREKREGYF